MKALLGSRKARARRPPDAHGTESAPILRMIDSFQRALSDRLQMGKAARQICMAGLRAYSAPTAKTGWNTSTLACETLRRRSTDSPSRGRNGRDHARIMLTSATTEGRRRSRYEGCKRPRSDVGSLEGTRPSRRCSERGMFLGPSGISRNLLETLRMEDLTPDCPACPVRCARTRTQLLQRI